jgi:hypothetical protein
VHAELRRDAAAKSLADSAAPSAATSALTAARGRSEVAPLGAAASPSPSPSPLARPGAELEAALAGDPARVRWRMASGRLVGHAGAQGEWWAALRRATEGRWLRADSVSEATAAELLIDGLPRGSLAFEPQAVVWRDAAGLVWRAPVADATLREWRGAIAGW